MAEFAHWLDERASKNATHMYKDSSSTSLSNSTKALIHSLAFAESKSIRTSTIILTSFNIVVATAIATSIVYDAYWSSKRCSSDGKAQRFCISKIHPAETFPLIMAIGIVVQSFVFAGVQSVGLQSLYTRGCSTLAQILFPALFLVPYMLVVFGLECTGRSLKKLPFRPRGKYDVTICLVTVGLMTFVTWIPTRVNREPNLCFASLMWFVTEYGVLGLVLISVSIGLSLLNAVVICYRLSTISSIDKDQRIAASRMVYYLLVGALVLSFVLPWFVALALHKPVLVASMMATVVVNLSGIVLCAIQLFLRSNTVLTSFGPKGDDGWGKASHEIKVWGPNELGFARHMLQPITEPRLASESKSSLVRSEKPEVDYTQSPRSVASGDMSQAMTEPCTPWPISLEPTTTVPSGTMTSPRGQPRPAYSLFPTGADLASPVQGQVPMLTSSRSAQAVKPHEGEAMIGQAFSLDDIKSIYISNDLEPPPSLNKIIGSGKRHRRDSSMISSATVQIGLRISHAPEQGTYQASSPRAAMSPKPSSPPRLQTQNLGVQGLATQAAHGPTSLQRMEWATRDARTKTLPPLPQQTPQSNGLDDDASPSTSPTTIIQLSPTVYSPDTPVEAGEPRSSLLTTPAKAQLAAPKHLQAPTADNVHGSQARASKADWI